MPEWGFTAEMRELRPWGLEPWTLEPCKRTTDPVHSDLYWTKLERELIDSPAFQRLRLVRQLGATLKVFPGAEHSRFTHSLGAQRVAQDLLDGVLSDRLGGSKPLSLIDEWRELEDPDEFTLRVAEATVLVRLGALLHDLTHVPYGHTIEDDLGILTPHDANQARFNRLWRRVPLPLRRRIEGARSRAQGVDRELFAELKDIILSKRDHLGDSPYPFAHDMVGNTICADLLDYLARDHLHTGLGLAFGTTYQRDFYVRPDNPADPYARRMVVRVVRDGKVRRDIVTELLKILRYRYEETERALYHHAKLSVDSMLGKILEMLADVMWRNLAIERLPSVSGSVSVSQDAAVLRRLVADSAGEGVCAAIDREIETLLEDLFTTWNDDGLLIYLRTLLAPERHSSLARHAAVIGNHNVERDDPPDARQQGVVELLDRVLNRDNFKPIGQSSPKAVNNAKQTYKRFETADARRRLERNVASKVGIEPAWQIVLWVPPPSMRFKVAEVLIDDGETVSELGTFHPDASQIVQRHRELWTVRVFVPEEVRDEPRLSEVILAFIAEAMHVPLVDLDGETVRPVREIMAERLSEEFQLGPSQRRELEALVPAARGEATWRTLLSSTLVAAKAKGLVERGARIPAGQLLNSPTS